MKVIAALQTQSLAGTTAATALISMSGAQRLLFIISGDAASSGCDITLKQAQSGGAGEKVLPFTDIAKIAKATGVQTRETVAANSHALVLDDFVYAIEIDSADLDSENDFQEVQVEVSGATAADELSIIAIVTDLRYQSDAP